MRRGPGKTMYWEQYLHGPRKSDPQKVRIATPLRRETTMTLEWAANRLCMGAPTHVASLLQRRNPEGRNSGETDRKSGGEGKSGVQTCALPISGDNHDLGVGS